MCLACRLLLERTVDLINGIAQARQSRLTSEKRRISKWVWALMVLLAMSSFYGVLLIQGGSLIVNLSFCGLTIVAMTASFVVLADMEAPFSGFVRIDLSCFTMIRRDIRVVLRAAHLEQMQYHDSSRDLTRSQTEMLTKHKKLNNGRSVAKLDVTTSISNAEQRLTSAKPRPRRNSIT